LRVAKEIEFKSEDVVLKGEMLSWRFFSFKVISGDSFAKMIAALNGINMSTNFF